MPLGSRPLSRNQIAQIRAWITVGAPANASADAGEGPVYRLAAKGVVWSGATALHVSVKTPVKSYFTLVIASAVRAQLYTRSASVKDAPERMDTGAPGSWIRWTVRRERDWPERLDVELEIRYASQPPLGASLLLEDAEGKKLAFRKL